MRQISLLTIWQHDKPGDVHGVSPVLLFVDTLYRLPYEWSSNDYAALLQRHRMFYMLSSSYLSSRYGTRWPETLADV